MCGRCSSASSSSAPVAKISFDPDSNAPYLQRARQVFEERPDAAVYLFGHTHAAFLQEENGRVILNTGSWLKLLHRVSVRFGKLPPVYFPTFRLSVFRIYGEGDQIVIEYREVAKAPEQELSGLQRTLLLAQAAGAAQADPCAHGHLVRSGGSRPAVGTSRHRVRSGRPQDGHDVSMSLRGRLRWQTTLVETEKCPPLGKSAPSNLGLFFRFANCCKMPSTAAGRRLSCAAVAPCGRVVLEPSEQVAGRISAPVGRRRGRRSGWCRATCTVHEGKWASPGGVAEAVCAQQPSRARDRICTPAAAEAAAARSGISLLVLDTLAVQPPNAYTCISAGCVWERFQPMRPVRTGNASDGVLLRKSSRHEAVAREFGQEESRFGQETQPVRLVGKWSRGMQTVDDPETVMSDLP